MIIKQSIVIADFIDTTFVQENNYPRNSKFYVIHEIDAQEYQKYIFMIYNNASQNMLHK